MRFFLRQQKHSASAIPDLNQVMTASQSIMSEIVLAKLLPKLMTMILNMTKATKAAIVLVKENEWEIAIIGTSHPTREISLKSTLVKSRNLLPLSVINHVVQTQETILLNSATKQGNYITDSYIQENKSKTILCLPLIGKSNRLIGVIYLENNLLTSAFHPQQLDILKLIPIGLCIENAQLYQQLEATVQELKRSEQVSRGQTAVLTSTLNVLTQEPELNKLLETVLTAISKQLHIASSVLWFYDSERDIISHYMSHQEDLDIGFSQPALPSKIYYQASMHPFWGKLLNSNDYIYLSVKPEQIIDSDFYQWLIKQDLKSLLILPLVLGGKLLGLLTIQSMVAKTFTDEQIELAMALAKQASLAMQLTNLAAKNRSAAILEERNRLAREIHDTLAQTFTGISIQAGIVQSIVEQKPAEAKKLIDRIRKLAKEGLTEARRSVWALYPEILECNNLPEALSQLVAKMTANTKIKTEINIQGTPIALNSKISLNLLRITQEAINNSLKHAQAQNIWLELSFNSDRVKLKLKDDGRGFEPQLSANNGGFGLIGMRQRAKKLGSKLEIISQLEQGTEITVEVLLSDYLSKKTEK